MQYIDDTVFMCPSKMESVPNIKYVLRNFKLMAGFRVNFGKCCIVKINTDSGLVKEMADLMMCEVGKLPMSYLDLMSEYIINQLLSLN